MILSSFSRSHAGRQAGAWKTKRYVIFIPPKRKRAALFEWQSGAKPGTAIDPFILHLFAARARGRNWCHVLRTAPPSAVRQSRIVAPMAHCGWSPFASAPAIKSAQTQTGAGSSKLIGTFAEYRTIGFPQPGTVQLPALKRGRPASWPRLLN